MDCIICLTAISISRNEIILAHASSISQVSFAWISAYFFHLRRYAFSVCDFPSPLVLDFDGINDSVPVLVSTTRPMGVIFSFKDTLSFHGSWLLRENTEAHHWIDSIKKSLEKCIHSITNRSQRSE